MSEGQTPSVGRAVAAATIAAALAALIQACLRGHVRVCSPCVGLYFWNLQDAHATEAFRDHGERVEPVPEKQTEAERMREGGEEGTMKQQTGGDTQADKQKDCLGQC